MGGLFDDEESRRIQELVDALLGKSPATSSLPRGFLDGFSPSPPFNPFSGLERMAGGFPVDPLKPLNFPPIVPLKPKVRRAFFSFHYADIMRVNNVRNAMQFQEGVEAHGFYDGSLWESSKRTNPDSLMRLIRDGMDRSSVLCVLYGSETWARSWVRYEIARSIVDGMGILAVDINGIAHHIERVPHRSGPNPLDFMAVGQMRDGTFRIFELADGWVPYENYTRPVTLPKYLPTPAVDYVTPLSKGALWYDYQAENGSKNLGLWLDVAAIRAGRS